MDLVDTCWGRQGSLLEKVTSAFVQAYVETGRRSAVALPVGEMVASEEVLS